MRGRNSPDPVRAAITAIGSVGRGRQGMIPRRYSVEDFDRIGKTPAGGNAKRPIDQHLPRFQTRGSANQTSQASSGSSPSATIARGGNHPSSAARILDETILSRTIALSPITSAAAFRRSLMTQPQPNCRQRKQEHRQVRLASPRREQPPPPPPPPAAAAGVAAWRRPPTRSRRRSSTGALFRTSAVWSLAL